MTQKLSEIQMTELNELQKMKVVQQYQLIQKQLLKPTRNPKTAQYGSKKVKNDPKINSKS